MKTIIKIEELAQFLLSLFAFHLMGFSWSWYGIFILAADISMLGYLANTKLGAFAYNLAHHKGTAIAILLTGVYFQSRELQFAGIILHSHSSLDKILGYGLKYSDSFQNTHLGKIGKQ